MKLHRSYGYWVRFIALTVIVTGCVTTPKVPIHLDPAFSERQIDSITLLPVVDVRKDKSFDIDMSKIRDRIRRILEKRGYMVSAPSAFAAEAQPTPDEISEMSVAELSELGSPSSKALLFIFLEDISSSYVVLGYTFKIEASASLIDKESRSLLWRDKGIGTSGQGGLISGLMQGLNRSEAISICINTMLESFPRRFGRRR